MALVGLVCSVLWSVGLWSVDAGLIDWNDSCLVYGLLVLWLVGLLSVALMF